MTLKGKAQREALGLSDPVVSGDPMSAGCLFPQWLFTESTPGQQTG